VGEKPKKSKAEEAPVQVELPPLNKDLTVFVNNLDFGIKESFLQTFFAEHAGKMRSLRFGKNAKGQSRGFATIDFEDEDSYKKALKLDRTRLNGRPVFISPYQDVGSASFKAPVQHPTGRNPRTLFVSQLPSDCLEENLRELFSPYEGFKTVRLGLKKDGSSKGFAYVDFDSEAQAAKALEMDGKIVGGNVISVLISDPSLAPKRQHQKKSMVPPTISKQQIAKKAEEPQQVEKQPESSPRVATGATNEDFRKMLGL
jgi:RNA recognition motif-containing protein